MKKSRIFSPINKVRICLNKTGEETSSISTLQPFPNLDRINNTTKTTKQVQAYPHAPGMLLAST